MHKVHFIKRNSPVEYMPMLERQQTARDALASGEGPNTVFLLEHTPTITLGRRARPEHILADGDTLARLGIQVLQSDRGGDVTYHGPGQMVAYPILNLNAWRPSVDWYLRALEETVLQLLRGYGLAGERLEGYTGVWVGGAKVAAVGVSVRQWITGHGLALNVSPDEAHWRVIIPCGIKDKPVTSLARLVNPCPPMEDVMERYVRAFEEVFACETLLDEE